MLDWQPIILSLKLASCTTVILLIISIPIANWLAYSKSKLKPIAEAIITLPIVLPPTVLGFYLLIAFSPESVFGSFLINTLGIELLFSFKGLLIASLIYSLPFMVHPIQSGFMNLSSGIRDASFVLGKSNYETLFKVLLPNIKPSIVTGVVLAFAHTLGEFGLVLMIGGNIPGKTKVASIAIYDEVEALNYHLANQYSLVLIGITFLVLLSVFAINAGYLKRIWK